MGHFGTVLYAVIVVKHETLGSILKRYRITSVNKATGSTYNYTSDSLRIYYAVGLIPQKKISPVPRKIAVFSVAKKFDIFERY